MGVLQHPRKAFATLGWPQGRPTETWVSVCPASEAETSSCVHTIFGHDPLGANGKPATRCGSEWSEGASVGQCVVAEWSMGLPGASPMRAATTMKRSTCGERLGGSFISTMTGGVVVEDVGGYATIGFDGVRGVGWPDCSPQRFSV